MRCWNNHINGKGTLVLIYNRGNQGKSASECYSRRMWNGRKIILKERVDSYANE